MKEYMHLGADADLISDDPLAGFEVVNTAVDYSIEALQLHCDAINNVLNDHVESRPIEKENEFNSIGLYLYDNLVHEWVYVEFGDRSYLVEDALRIVSIIEKSLDASMRKLFGGALPDNLILFGDPT